MAPKAQTLYLIDGHAQLHRAYHAIPPGSMFAADRKTPTNAVYGFTTMLRAMRNRFKPDLLAAVFDPHGPVKREAQYDAYAAKLGPAFSGYKSQRDSLPDDLRPQIEMAIEVCRAFGIPALQVAGYEADDVLGTLARQAAEQGYKVVVVSGDKDLLQLVGGPIQVYDPMKDIMYDEDTVLTLKGIRPSQIPDWLGFRGDATDNIPGVEGVGEKTAIELLKQHGTMEQALEHYREKLGDRVEDIRAYAKAVAARKDGEKVKPPRGIKVVEANLFSQQERALACRELARLDTNAPLALDPDAMRCKPPEPAQLVPLLKRLDFRSLLRDLGMDNIAQTETQAPADTAPEGAATPAEAAASDESQARYMIVDDKQKLAAFAREFSRQKRFAVDTETVGEHIRMTELVGVSLSWKPHEAFYLPVRGPGESKLLSAEQVRQTLGPALEDGTIGKTGHNIKYDFQVLRNFGIEMRGIACDTMVAGWLLDPGQLRFSLDEMSYKHLGVRKLPSPAATGKGKDQIPMDQVPVADVGTYSCGDADRTWRLGCKLEPMLEDAGLTPLMRDVEAPLITVLADMEWTGIKLDASLLHQMSRNLEEQLAAQEADIYHLAGERFNINSPQQLAAILFDKLGLTPRSKTATGRESTSEEVLRELGREHELPQRILDYRGMLKLKNTYVDQLPGMVCPKTGRIHARFNQTGTETGRLSSSDPNLQNIPIRSELGRSIRAAFKPGQEDWRILTADYSQIELRVLAHYSHDTALREAFARGTDIHTAVAARLNGVAEDKVTREQRTQAKAVNFGIIYGQTAFGLAQTISISRHEAQKIIDAYFAGHPQVRECIQRIVADAGERGFVTTVLGRRRFIPQLHASDRMARALGERLAVNTVFQGSAADLIKKAMNEIHHVLTKDKWQARMILQIHDELVFECPPAEVEPLRKLVQQKMEGALKLDVPLVVDVGVGADWLGAKE